MLQRAEDMLYRTSADGHCAGSFFNCCSKPVSQPNSGFANWNANKQPLATSRNQPEGDVRRMVTYGGTSMRFSRSSI
jgi:hypothetical protein